MERAHSRFRERRKPNRKASLVAQRLARIREYNDKMERRFDRKVVSKTANLVKTDRAVEVDRVDGVGRAPPCSAAAVVVAVVAEEAWVPSVNS